MVFGALVFAGIVLAVVWFAAAYNNLVAAAHRAVQAWANVDALLRQRHDELPRLIDVCERHVRHEPAIFRAVQEARTAIFAARQTDDATALSAAETALRNAVLAIRRLPEKYPELGVDPEFAALQQRIGVLDGGIDERRAIYNEAVQQNNRAIRQFPGRIVALLGGFRSLTPFDV